MPDPLWLELAAAAGLTLDQADADLLERYLDLLIAANEKMNLTRIVDRPQARLFHIADALTLLPFLNDAHRLVDVGSGGGIPGIPLAIVRPDLLVTLVESTQKKARFLESAVADLGLTNVRVNARRAEEVARGDQRERFDVAVSRAVAELALICEWCLPLIRIGGSVLTMKGPRVKDEIPAAQQVYGKMGGALMRTHPVHIPQFTGHVIIQIQKPDRTPAKYPRHPTHAKGEPLH